MPRVVGLARSACWLIAVFLVGAPVVTAALEEEALAVVEGTIQPSGPIVAKGGIASADDFFATWKPQVVQDSLYKLNGYFAEDVEYEIHEIQWFTIGADPGSEEHKPLLTLPTKRLQPGRMEIKEVGDKSMWIARPYYGGQISVPDATQCSIASGAPEAVQIGNVREQGPWRADLSVLHINCNAPRLLIEGPVFIRIEGSTVHVSGTDATGAPYSRDICTGLCTEPFAAPNVYRHTYTYIWVRPSQFSDPVFEFMVPSELHLQTPSVAVVGKLNVPAAKGLLSWADWQAPRDIPALEMQGAFALEADGMDGVGLTGATTNRPMANAMGRETTSVIGRNAGWGLAAAAGACMAASPFHPRLRWLLLGLFSRLSEQRAMAHPRRQQIVEAVRSNPGVKVQEVCRMLELSRGVADHHVEVLCRQGVLVCRRFGRETGLFVKGAVDWDVQPQVQRLRNETVRNLLQHVQAEPTITQTELATRLNVGQSYVCRVLKQLMQLGVLTPVEDGGRRRAYQVSTVAAGGWLPPSTPDGMVSTPTPVAAAAAESVPTFAAMSR